MSAVVAILTGVYMIYAVSHSEHASSSTPVFKRDSRTASAVSAAVLAGLGVEAVSSSIIGGALSVAATASLSAGVTLAADSLLGDIAAGVATGEAQASQGHDSQLVGARLSGNIGGSSQKGNGGGDSEKHRD
jgi:hypothetical protein